MTEKELRDIRNWFENYVETFVTGDLESVPVLSNKKDHSLQVAGTCRVLAEDLTWTEPEAHTAEALGLLHDIGRFSQYIEYGTFIDIDSINHCERGYEIVSAAPQLNHLPGRSRQIILDGIRYHSSKEFMAKVSRESIPYVHLIRDADKLDKFRVLKESIEGNPNRGMYDTTLSIQTDGPVNPTILDKIRRKKSISKKEINSLLDYYLFQLSHVFEIHYKPTYKRMLGYGTLEIITGIMPDEKGVTDALNTIANFLKNHA